MRLIIYILLSFSIAVWNLLTFDIDKYIHTKVSISNYTTPTYCNIFNGQYYNIEYILDIHYINSDTIMYSKLFQNSLEFHNNSQLKMKEYTISLYNNSNIYDFHYITSVSNGYNEFFIIYSLDQNKMYKYLITNNSITNIMFNENDEFTSYKQYNFNVETIHIINKCSLHNNNL